MISLLSDTAYNSPSETIFAKKENNLKLNGQLDLVFLIILILFLLSRTAASFRKCVYAGPNVMRPWTN